MKKKTGYTLVEIMVVVASVGLIMTALVGVVLGTFRAQNRNMAMNKVSENGTWIINELRKNTFNSSSESVVCGEEEPSIWLKSIQDGGSINLTCDSVNNEIASTSAIKKDVLNSKEVKIIDCNNFVVCEINENGDFVGVSFNFGLMAEVNGVGSSQFFSTKVTVRN